MHFAYKKTDRLLFYWKTFTVKFFKHWFEVKRPKLKTFIYNIAYTAKYLLTNTSQFPSPFNVDMVETLFGKFRIRPHTVDMIYISPSFERRDIDYLLRLVIILNDAGKSILLADIGANIGAYCIAVGNTLKNRPNTHIIAVEPAKSTYKLLAVNIELNGLADRITLFNYAAFSRDDQELNFSFNPCSPGESGLSEHGTDKVVTKTLNTLLADKAPFFDVIIFKMDIEGAEEEVFKGTSGILDLNKEFYFLIEDIVNPGIIAYLENMGAEFIGKLTPYNSWWRYAKQ
jgi:FkbM family methyltransferase